MGIFKGCTYRAIIQRAYQQQHGVLIQMKQGKQIWVNYNELTATSAEKMVTKE